MTIRKYIRELLQESITEVDFDDNLKFLPEHDIDLGHPDVVNRCSTFDIEELQKIRTWAGKKRYLENCLPKLGSGSGRVVFLIEPTKVIKLAKNDKGVAQNEVEASLKNDTDNYPVLAQVLDYDDENYFWVKMEVAKKLDTKSFKEATGINWKDYSKAMQYYDWDQRGIGRYWDQIPENVQENDFFQDMTQAAGNLGLVYGDLHSPRNFGIVERDGKKEAVLIDIGLNQNVYDDYYKPKRRNF